MAGSWPNTSESIFEEGTLCPPVKLYASGHLNSDLYDVLLRNSRFPEDLRGDIDSFVGANEMKWEIWHAAEGQNCDFISDTLCGSGETTLAPEDAYGEGEYWIVVDGDAGGFAGAYSISVEANRCGDLSVDEIDGEKCDDGNTSSDDGCSDTCQLED